MSVKTVLKWIFEGTTIKKVIYSRKSRRKEKNIFNGEDQNPDTVYLYKQAEGLPFDGTLTVDMAKARLVFHGNFNLYNSGMGDTLSWQKNIKVRRAKYSLNGRAEMVCGTVNGRDAKDGTALRIFFYDENNRLLHQTPYVTKQDQPAGFIFSAVGVQTLYLTFEAEASQFCTSKFYIENFRYTIFAIQ